MRGFLRRNVFLVLILIIKCGGRSAEFLNSDNETQSGEPIEGDLNHEVVIESEDLVWKLFLEIVAPRKRRCELIFLNDEYFEREPLSWMEELETPYYSFDINSVEIREYSTRVEGVVLRKGAGFLECADIIIACFNLQTCTVSPFPFKLLSKNDIIPTRRRTYIYFKNETVSKVIQPSDTVKNYEDDPLLSSIGKIVRDLKSHVTFIRPLRHPPNRNHEIKVKKPPAETFQLLTWTTNWLPGGSPIFPTVWSPRLGFWNGGRGVPHIRRNDIQRGGTVRFCTPSFNLLPEIQIFSDTEFYGVGAPLIQSFRDQFGFLTDFIEPPDEDPGALMEDGSWTGVTNEVIQKKADIGIGQIVFTPQRLNANVIFSPTFAGFAGVIVCPTPGYLSKWWMIIEPFSTLTWLGVILSFISILICIKALQFLIRILFPNRKKPRLNGPNDINKSDLSWLYIVGPLLMKTIPSFVICKRHSFLCLLGFWMLFGFIMSLGYSTILIGALTFPPVEEPINTVYDLLLSGKKWIFAELIEELLDPNHDGSGLSRKENYLINEALSHQAAGFTDTDGVEDLAEYDYVRASGNCLIADKTRAELIISRYSTGSEDGHRISLLRVSGSSFLLGSTGWIMRSDADFLLVDYFHKLFAAMKGSGILEKASEQYKTRFDNSEPRGPQPLGMDSVQVIFYLLAIGLATSLFAFLIELLYFYGTPPARNHLHKICSEYLPKERIGRRKGGNTFEYLP